MLHLYVLLGLIFNQFFLIIQVEEVEKRRREKAHLTHKKGHDQSTKRALSDYNVNPIKSMVIWTSGSFSMVFTLKGKAKILVSPTTQAGSFY